MAKKRKRKGEPVKYLRGATWKDVLAGRPVTATEVEAKEKKPKGGAIVSRCLRCRRVAPVVYSKGRAAPCQCGGAHWRPLV